MAAAWYERFSWAPNGARGRPGAGTRPAPGATLILMGDWCAQDRDATPNEDRAWRHRPRDAKIQPYPPPSHRRKTSVFALAKRGLMGDAKIAQGDAFPYRDHVIDR